MSVRTEPRDLSQQLHQTLTIPADVMTAGAMVGAPAPGSANEHHLHEANTFNTNNEHHPLERTVCINIRASLSDLCLRANTATWSPPSSEATKSIFQQAHKNAHPKLSNKHEYKHVSRPGALKYHSSQVLATCACRG